MSQTPRRLVQPLISHCLSVWAPMALLRNIFAKAQEWSILILRKLSGHTRGPAWLKKELVAVLQGEKGKQKGKKKTK